MPQAAAVAIYNFVNAAVLYATGNAVIAYNAGQFAVAAAAATAKLALVASANAVIANQNKPESQGGLVNIAINPNEPRRLIVGTRQTGGLLVDWLIKGSKNQNLYYVVYLSEGPCGALKKVLSGGRVVYDADVSGAFVHGVRKTIPNFRSGGDRLWITYHDGRPGQAADANLISQFPGVWTANHLGTGCAYVVVEMQWDSDNLTSPPGLSFEMEGALCYDRRMDSTAGGAGSHRLDDPSTWQLTSNPAVILDHYFLGRYLGDIKTFGMGIPADMLPYSQFAALANLCDESVALKEGGTQPRYEANGFLFADRSFKDTIKDLCRAMNARPVDRGGMIGILDGQPKTPVMTISDKDLVEGTTDNYRPKQSWGELVTAAMGTYIAPNQNYQPVDFPTITNPAWDAEDNGQPKFETIDFEMETSQERAERLAKLFVQMKRRQARLTGTYKFRTIQLEQGDWFTRTGGKFAGGKTFEVLDRILNPKNMSVTLAAFEVDPEDSAWDEADATDIIPAPVLDDSGLPVMGLPGIVVTPISFTVGDLTFPAFRFVNLDALDPIPYGVSIEFGISDGEVDPGPEGEIFTHMLAPGQVQSAVYGLFPDQTYVVRVRNFFGAVQSPWSDWIEVDSTPTYSTGGDGTVEWVNVVGVGRPFDLADVTGSNTAAAIAGQGWAATQGQFATDNQYPLLRMAPGLCRNAAFAEPFTGTAIPPGWSEWVSGAGTFAALPGAPGSGYLHSSAAAQTVGGCRQLVPARAGLTYLMEAEIFRTAGNLVPSGMAVLWVNSGGTEFASEYIFFGTNAPVSGGVSSTPDGLRRWEKLVTAPAGTVSARVYAIGHWDNLGSVASATSIHWKLCDLRPLTLVSQLGANVTGSHISAGFAGQGALATLNNVNSPQIIAGAVSVVSATYTAGAGGGSLGITTSGGPLVINAALLGEVQSDNTPCGISVSIYRGGTLIYGPIEYVNGFGNAKGAFATTLVDQPGAGSYTYSIAAGQNGTDISYFATASAAIAITELKR